MKLHVLWGHRPERYEGEYAPEALAVADECTQDDNPDYMREEYAKYQKTGDFAHLRVVTFEINGAKVMDLLRGTHKPLPAEALA